MKRADTALLFLVCNAAAVSAGVVLSGCDDQTVARPGLPTVAPSAAPSGSPTPADETAVDAGSKADATADAESGPRCTSTFGSGITAEFGRLDGTVRAVVIPGNYACPGDNDHVMIQVDTATGTYPLAVNVQSTSGADRAVRFAEAQSALVGPAWESGWHAGASLDYGDALGAHSTDVGFAPVAKSELAARIAARVVVGSQVSIFADGYDTGNGAHKIHRNGGSRDGAIVVDPTGDPTYLVFHFANQSF